MKVVPQYHSRFIPFFSLSPMTRGNLQILEDSSNLLIFNIYIVSRKVSRFDTVSIKA